MCKRLRPVRVRHSKYSLLLLLLSQVSSECSYSYTEAVTTLTVAIHMYRNAIWFVHLQLAAVQTRWHWCTQYMQIHSLLPFPTSNQSNSPFSFSVTGVCVGNTVQVESHLRQSPLAPLAKPRFKPAAKGATAVMCPFCKRNGETPEFYTTHKLKDCWGRVICPVLRAYTCPNCGISGDNAHTLNYCPYK